MKLDFYQYTVSERWGLSTYSRWIPSYFSKIDFFSGLGRTLCLMICFNEKTMNG
jgi:hypothetical protein